MGANCLCSHLLSSVQLLVQEDKEDQLQMCFQILIASGGDDQSIGLIRLSVRLIFDLVCPSLLFISPSLISILFASERACPE
jgi:hypothetical protein